MASGTQNLSSKIYIKTQNKQITEMGWRGLFRQPLARQCNSNCFVQHNFQLTSIFLEFCQHTAGFTCPGWIFLHDRCTSAPLAFKPICCKNAFFVAYGLLCAAAWADVAEACKSHGCSWNVRIPAGHWKTLCPLIHKNRITANYPVYSLLGGPKKAETEQKELALLAYLCSRRRTARNMIISILWP